MKTTSARELEGKVALVTGASRNIGRAIALNLAEGGATVAINARSAISDAEKVAAEIRSAGGQAGVFMADISEARAVKAMVADILARYSKIDILVLNASVRTEKPFLEMTYEQWREPLAITLDGAFYCAQACIPSMLKAGGGSIVTLGGMGALIGASKRVHGSVAKSGLAGFTRALAREFGEQGIRVNCVAPGSVETARPAHRAPKRDPRGVVALERRAEPREIADAVRYLCGPASTYITGQTLHVNGGQLMT